MFKRWVSHFLSLFLLLAGLMPVQAQISFHPGGGVNDPGSNFTWGAGEILQFRDSIYDLGLLYKNGKYDLPLLYYGLSLGRYGKEKTITKPIGAYFDSPYIPYDGRTFSSSVKRMDSNHYFQYFTTPIGYSVSMYNLASGTKNEFSLKHGAILNKNLLHRPPYFYFLIGKSQRYFRDSTGKIIWSNNGYITSDTLTLLRFHTQQEKFDTVGVFTQPLQGLQKVIRARGFLDINSAGSTFRFVKNTDTLLTYRLGQIQPVKIKSFYKDTKFLAYFRNLNHLIIYPKDTIRRLGAYEKERRPDQIMAKDTLLLQEYTLDTTAPSIFKVDSIFLKAPGFNYFLAPTYQYIRDQQGNFFVAATSRSSANPETKRSMRVYKYDPQKNLLWQTELYPDSALHTVADMGINKQNELLIFSNIYSSRRNEFFFSHPVLTLFKNTSPPEAASLSIFPNPTRDVLFVVSAQNWQEGIITDLSGKVVYKFQHQANRTTRLDLSQLKSGMYLVHLQNKAGQHRVQKILKR